jgi:hypothetical protein
LSVKSPVLKLVDEYGNVIGIVSAKLNASAALAASGRCRRM